jgi:hypothetical protein
VFVYKELFDHCISHYTAFSRNNHHTNWSVAAHKTLTFLRFMRWCNIFMLLASKYCKLLIICVQIIQFVDYPCTTFFYTDADMCELCFRPLCTVLYALGVGVGFKRVYRRYGQTIPFIFGPLWSVSGVGQGGSFQWWWRQTVGDATGCLVIFKYQCLTVNSVMLYCVSFRWK